MLQYFKLRFNLRKDSLDLNNYSIKPLTEKQILKNDNESE